MLGELLDNAISVFSPALAAKRAHARSVYQRISKRGAFEGAKLDRTTGAWTANSQTADQTLYGDAERIRNRARDLIRNNAYARGAIDAIVANVIGCGIAPRPTLEDDDQNELIRDEWDRWCESADLTGHLHFYELQALALREMIEAGEDLVHFTADSDPLRSVPLALELVESERIASDVDTFRFSRTQNGNEVRRGVELDGRGRAAAYYIYRAMPSQVGVAFGEIDRHRAEDFLHLFRRDRIGQTRGISWLAPAMIWLRDLGLYVDNELQASAVASCFTVAIKTIDSGATFSGLATPSDGETTDADGNRFERIQPALVSHLMPGESIETINPSRPNSQAEPWINLILRSIAVSMGLSYELVSRDYSKTNFSSNRASALEDRRRFRPVQKFIVWHLCQPIYREFFKSCVLAERPGFPSLIEFVQEPEKFLSCRWQTPGWEWVDPLKEVNANKIAVDEGFKSRSDVIEEGGGNVREVFYEKAAEDEFAAKIGLKLGEAAKANAQLALTEEEGNEQEERQTASAAYE